MTTLHEMVEALMAAEGLQRKPRSTEELRPVPASNRPGEDAWYSPFAGIAKPNGPDDRL